MSEREERCRICDRPRATDEDYANIGEGLGEHLCWGRWDVGQCESGEVDWRARYLALSSRDSTPTDREALLWKWLHRAADTLARNQDDERVVFLLDFDRAFPDAKEPQS